MIRIILLYDFTISRLLICLKRRRRIRSSGCLCPVLFLLSLQKTVHTKHPRIPPHYRFLKEILSYRLHLYKFCALVFGVLCTSSQKDRRPKCDRTTHGTASPSSVSTHGKMRDFKKQFAMVSFFTSFHDKFNHSKASLKFTSSLVPAFP
jgi:hypothetical protein